MAIKTFTTGEVLTAADTNTYLANSGLVFVKSTTVGSGVASVSVSDAFSATYDAYKIIWSGGTMSADTNLLMTIGAANTAYYLALVYGSFGGGSASVAGNSNSVAWSWGGGGGSDGADASVELSNPFLTRTTQMQARIRYSSVYGNSVGHLANNTSYTSFAFAPASGTMTGGTIVVYGYRKA
jgi:hypothetical protein